MTDLIAFCRLPVLLLVMVASACEAAKHESQVERFFFQERHMGTDFRIFLYAADTLQAETAAFAVFERIGELDRTLSPYRSESELSRFNEQAGSSTLLQVGEALCELLHRGIQAGRETQGAFDLTVGPLVELWQRSRRTGRPVDKQEVRDAQARVGYDLIELDSERCKARLSVKGMKIDPGGIGKGLAVDQALAILKAHGVTSALVDGGGDIAVSGAPPGTDGWTVQIGRFSEDDEELQLLLEHQAVATSGDLYQFVEVGGVRYSHIIDPSTGKGLPGRRMVSVIASEAVTADVLATAVAVMGPEESERRLQPGTAFLWLSIAQDGSLHRVVTPTFSEWIVPVCPGRF